MKASLLGRVLQLSQQCGDSVLVFTTSIPTLNYLDKLLKAQKIAHARIDGSTAMLRRNEIIANFQANKYSVLLISTKAGGTLAPLFCRGRSELTYLCYRRRTQHYRRQPRCHL